MPEEEWKRGNMGTLRRGARKGKEACAGTEAQRLLLPSPESRRGGRRGRGAAGKNDSPTGRASPGHSRLQRRRERGEAKRSAPHGVGQGGMRPEKKRGGSPAAERPVENLHVAQAQKIPPFRAARARRTERRDKYGFRLSRIGKGGKPRAQPALRQALPAPARFLRSSRADRGRTDACSVTRPSGSSRCSRFRCRR